MITQLTIDRFKSVRNASMDLGQVNLFIGANGSGKSNILEALGLVAASLGRGVGNSELLKKGVRLSPPELMKSAHKNLELPKTFELSVSFSEGIKYKCNLTSSPNDAFLRFFSESCIFKGKRQFGRSPRGNKALGLSLFSDLEKNRGAWDQIKVAFEFDPIISEAFSSFNRFAIYSPQTDFLRGRKTGGIIDEPPIGLHGEGLPDAVATLIRQAIGARLRSTAEQKSEAEFARRAINLAYLPGWTRGVRVGILDKSLLPTELLNSSEKMVYFLDRFMRDDRNKLSAYDSSEGTLFLLFTAVLLASREAPRYFAIDNVDSALNPRMTRKLVEAIIQMTLESTAESLSIGPRQVFLTSHNPTSLDAFDIFDERQRAFVVKRDDAGHTVVTRLEPRGGMTKQDWALATNGRKLSQLWLDDMIQGANGNDGI